MTKQYVAVIKNEKTERVWAIGSHATLTEAIGSLLLTMQNQLYDEIGPDASLKHDAVQTCGIMDNGEDALCFRTEAYADDYKTHADRIGYVFEIREEA